MVKKVILDKLEIEETDLVHTESAPPVTAENAAPVKKPSSTRIKIFLPAAGIFMVVAFMSYWWLTAKETVPLARKKIAPLATRLSTGPAPVKADGFFVLLKDSKGSSRVLAYDLAFELYAGQADRFRQNIVEVRKTIYETVRQKQPFSLAQMDAKNALKEEINADLGKLLGKDVIKAIYFTRFIIL